MLTSRPSDTAQSQYTQAGAAQRTTQLFISFLFAVFIFGFLRSALLNQEINSYELMVTAILLTIWYGFSLAAP